SPSSTSNLHARLFHCCVSAIPLSPNEHLLSRRRCGRVVFPGRRAALLLWRRFAKTPSNFIFCHSRVGDSPGAERGGRLYLWSCRSTRRSLRICGILFRFAMCGSGLQETIALPGRCHASLFAWRVE